MPGKIYDGTNWRSVSGVFARVGTEWKRANRGWINDGTSWRTIFLARIEDTFNRANASSLGTTSDGTAAWSNLRNSWGIVSNTASSSDAATGYPSATIETFGSSVLASVAPGPGTGIIFGVTDSNNWYGAYVSARSTTGSCNCQEQCGTCYYSCTVCNANCGSYSCSPCSGCSLYWSSYQRLRSAYICESDTNSTGGTYYFWVFWKNLPTEYPCITCTSNSLPACNIFNAGLGGSPTTTTWPLPGVFDLQTCSLVSSSDPKCPCILQTNCSTCYNCCSQTDPACGSYSCCETVCQTCISVFWSVRLVRCVNGTVTELAASEGAANGAQPTTLSVETGASTITVTGTGAGSPLSITANASVTGTRHGIIKAPSAYNQSSAVDNFAVENL